MCQDIYIPLYQVFSYTYTACVTQTGNCVTYFERYRFRVKYLEQGLQLMGDGNGGAGVLSLTMLMKSVKIIATQANIVRLATHLLFLA